MVTLVSVNKRFEVNFTVIQGGVGIVRGVLSETDQNSQPSYVFVQPRHVLRTGPKTAVTAGMVIRAPSGAPFIVGLNGPSEQPIGTLWQSFRLFEPTGQYLWQRRTHTLDAVAKQQREGPLQPMGTIWAAMEPLDRVQADREMRVNYDQSRVIAGADLQVGDLVDNRSITKVDKELGLAIGILT